MPTPSPSSVRLPGPAVHDLKTWRHFWEQLAVGAKLFELRRDDRGFAVGDILVLREYDPEAAVYSGRVIFSGVTSLAGEHDVPGLLPGFVVMTVEVLRTDGALGRPLRRSVEVRDVRT
jgi:hypothetical protein